jgi:5-methylcytosine-specific restriction protein B
MIIAPGHTQELLALLRIYYPGWAGFDNPRFVEDEVTYKHETVHKAQELLSQDEFERLIRAREYDEILSRLETVGRDNNLLWLQVPRRGDLGILYHPDLNKGEFAGVIYDLLYGQGTTPDRLDRYAAYCNEQALPNKWTFPTYLLFMLYPDREMFVKPTAAQWFFQFVDQKDRWAPRPNGATYAFLCQLVAELRVELAEYGPHDNIDIQGMLWACFRIQQRENKRKSEAQAESQPDKGDRTLAEPFSRMFTDWDEAEWAFELLKDTVQRLGITDPDDPRFHLSLRQYTGGPGLRLVFGNWIVAAFYGPPSAERRVELALCAEQAGDLDAYRNYRFSVPENSPVINLYYFPLDMIRDDGQRVLDLYTRTLDPISTIFSNWRRSPNRDVHRSDVAAALFDPARLPSLLRGDLIEPPPAGQSCFSETTFRLLADLTTNPTREFYQENKDAFAEHLEQPFRQLFADVVAQLPEPIIEALETEKNVHGRILKNDYGRGGAWDFLWSAIYPQGGRRTRDAQLYIWINRDVLRYGFSFGSDGAESFARFWRNIQNHSDSALSVLTSVLRQHPLIYGTFEERDEDPDKWLRSANHIPNAFIKLSTDEVLALSKEELVDSIAEAFIALFPFMIMATSDDPMPAIYRYLGEEPDEVEETNPEYALHDCSENTGISVETLQNWLKALERKKQAIFYGPPGTGKTFLAQELARHLIGGSDGFTQVVQFHPAYAYEDFMLGIRPRQRGESLHYPVVPGHFLEFCARAAERTGPCVLIIDEINRAELARVFGELMYLLEYRGEKVRLSVDRREFSVPENVRIIGTMNTADRSIALVDHALRRRFAFIALYPQYKVLEHYHRREKTRFDTAGLVDILHKLNKEIEYNYQVGITFFLRRDLKEHIAGIWQMEIEPYLEEYFFDQPGRVSKYRWQAVEKQIMGAST